MPTINNNKSKPSTPRRTGTKIHLKKKPSVVYTRAGSETPVFGVTPLENTQIPTQNTQTETPSTSAAKPKKPSVFKNAWNKLTGKVKQSKSNVPQEQQQPSSNPYKGLTIHTLLDNKSKTTTVPVPTTQAKAKQRNQRPNLTANNSILTVPTSNITRQQTSPSNESNTEPKLGNTDHETIIPGNFVRSGYFSSIAETDGILPTIEEEEEVGQTISSDGQPSIPSYPSDAAVVHPQKKKTPSTVPNNLYSATRKEFKK